ncbi:MAG: hypothetical protein KJ941_01425, partial [Bacteroidetes bacterium]|nr:hypothetical protein [Bacteroidota bacterium]
MRKRLQFTWVISFLLLPFDLPYFKGFHEFKLKFYASLASNFTENSIGFFSDNYGFWLAFFILPIVIFVLTFLFNFKEVKSIDFGKGIHFLLALVLFKYGMDKLFMQQFMRPEINLLTMPLNQFDKGFLFWTTMGTSRLFNLVSGSIEILVGILFIFNRTQRLGQLLGLFVFGFIFFINLSFNIGVKGFSFFLWLGCLIQCFKNFKLYWVILSSCLKEKKRLTALKAFTCLAILTMLYFEGKTRDDATVVERQFKVQNSENWTKIYQTKQGYLIFEDTRGEKESFPILDQNNDLLLIKFTR